MQLFPKNEKLLRSPILGPQGLLGASRRQSDDAIDNDNGAFTLLFLKGCKKDGRKG